MQDYESGAITDLVPIESEVDVLPAYVHEGLRPVQDEFLVSYFRYVAPHIHLSLKGGTIVPCLG